MPWDVEVMYVLHDVSHSRLHKSDAFLLSCIFSDSDLSDGYLDALSNRAFRHFPRLQEL